MVIGRNEGERLKRCLVAAFRQTDLVVYVDSESVDGSPILARSLGAHVVELDSSSRHTPARARNAGFEFLLQRNPDIQAVQFVDSDCELAEGWLDIAEAELEKHPEAGAICGRRRERFVDASIFTRLFELEWRFAEEDLNYFGGDVLIRASAFRETGGFNTTLFGGEDPELALRVRRKGWKIIRLARDMTVHDSNMMHFTQWWNRTIVAGHAFAEGSWIYGFDPEHHFLRQTLSIWFWGLALPLFVLAAACANWAGALLLFAAYIVLGIRIYLRIRRLGRSQQEALLYTAFCILGKFPQALGQIRFLLSRLSGRQSKRIYYKSA